MQIRRSYNVHASLGRTSHSLDASAKKKKLLIGLKPARWIFLHKLGGGGEGSRNVQLQLCPKNGLWYRQETGAGIISRIICSLLMAVNIVSNLHTEEDSASSPAEITTWIHHWQHTSDTTH